MINTPIGAERSEVRRQQQRWPLVVWALVFATIFALLRAGQTYLSFGPSDPAVPWWRLAIWQLLTIYVWMILTPVILGAGRRFTFERPHWPRSLIAHLLCGSLVAILNIGAYTVLTHALGIYPKWRMIGLDRFFHYIAMYFHFDLFTYFAILGLGLAVDYHRKYRENEVHAAELRAQLSRAQLEALRLQLQPHFLFNTLNSIVGLIRNNENREAVRMTTGLSELLRHVLEHAGRQEVSLREEMEFLTRYLDIQQMRFSDRLRVELKVDANTLDARVPSLILQPIVENAIRHGIAVREAGGLVSLSATRRNGHLCIDVFNDGPTLPSDWRVENGDGIGLANTRARLTRLYGAAGRLDVRNVAMRGVEASLTIPFLPATGVRDGHFEEKDQDLDRG